LRDGGVFSQWLQTYQISVETFRTILATFQSVFPEVLVFQSPGTPDCILVGSRRSLRIDLRQLHPPWADDGVPPELGRVGIDRPEHVLATLLLGPDGVRAAIQGASLNTDDNMRVEFGAPREMTGTTGATMQSVFALMGRYGAPVETLLVDPSTL